MKKNGKSREMWKSMEEHEQWKKYRKDLKKARKCMEKVWLRGELLEKNGKGTESVVKLWKNMEKT